MADNQAQRADDVATDGFAEAVRAPRLRTFEDDPRRPEYVVELVAKAIGAQVFHVLSDQANVGVVRQALESAAVAALREFGAVEDA